MPHDDLFRREQIIGVFRGYAKAACVMLSWCCRISDFQNMSRYGQFLWCSWGA